MKSVGKGHLTAEIQSYSKAAIDANFKNSHPYLPLSNEANVQYSYAQAQPPELRRVNLDDTEDQISVDLSGKTCCAFGCKITARTSANHYRSCKALKSLVEKNGI